MAKNIVDQVKSTANTVWVETRNKVEAKVVDVAKDVAAQANTTWVETRNAVEDKVIEVATSEEPVWKIVLAVIAAIVALVVLVFAGIWLL